jgi:hypothetical protein
MADWARTSLKPLGTEPEVNSKKRLELIAANAVANENASAAFTARQQFMAAIQTESQALEKLKIAISHAVAEVLAETASGQLIDDLRAAQHSVAIIKSKLEQSLQAVFAIAHAGPPSNPVFNLAAGLAEVFRNTAAPGLEPGAGFTDRKTWDDFAARLRTDPGAEL